MHPNALLNTATELVRQVLRLDHPADAVVFLARPEIPWDARRVIGALRGEGHAEADVEALLARLAALVRPGDTVVFMSNGGFEGAPHRFARSLG